MGNYAKFKTWQRSTVDRPVPRTIPWGCVITVSSTKCCWPMKRPLWGGIIRLVYLGFSLTTPLTTEPVVQLTSECAAVLLKAHCPAHSRASPALPVMTDLASLGRRVWSFSQVMSGAGSPSILHWNRARPPCCTTWDSGCCRNRERAAERSKRHSLRQNKLPVEKWDDHVYQGDQQLEGEFSS